jgi:hypothetical protein
MTQHLHASTHSGSSGSRWLAIIAACFAILFAGSLSAQAPAAAGGEGSVPSAEELDKLVGRIALYPDDLVGIILPASTNPLQLVQADRYLDKRKADPKLPVDEKWDDAVKSLLNYPEVVKTMSNDLDWTSALGEAVVADQSAVLGAIQAFRRKTQAVGNLKSDEKQTVVVEKEVIKIVPADPQVVYVPQYNPSSVVVYGGYSSYGYYPAPYPSYYYPYAPGAAFATGLIWGAAIGAAWGGNHYSPNYNNNNININNNNNINSGNRGNNSGNRGNNAGGGSQWKSNKQPGQVSNSVGKTSASNRAGYGGQGGGGGFGSSGGARASAQPTGGGGSRGGGGSYGGGGSSYGGGGSGGSSAFGGYSSGHQTSRESSRGSASRNSMSSSGSRGSGSYSGGSRGGGGGGGRGGGGGGRRR